MTVNAKQAIARLVAIYELRATVTEQPWSTRPVLPSRRSRGVYVISSGTRTLYVGRGYIHARQQCHREKFLGEFSLDRDTRGFREFRQKNGRIDLETLTLTVATLESETGIAALEAGLIHLLQPEANDETVTARTDPLG